MCGSVNDCLAGDLLARCSRLGCGVLVDWYRQAVSRQPAMVPPSAQHQLSASRPLLLLPGRPAACCCRVPVVAALSARSAPGSASDSHAITGTPPPPAAAAAVAVAMLWMAAQHLAFF